ncbi:MULTISPECIES: RIP metalloprotease [Microbacterium]|uniref:M50 family metallopeptidase n=1 Tax=Microbacterium TaxID=33882 RepID=UPI0027835A8F|nr:MULTISPECIES: site-2 protease family protein [Microbacterium]MDQ1073826.1 membrane-associated protease RseP (regulator of RpoE activity) [Microbacterium sp. SORGH_AS_0969]MDQ1114053.1 membrane-associated protease RseP (regulator of RpoE activity) [Microbacterium testaceum]
MIVIAFLIGVLVLVVGLAVSIALHEMGHLLPAKIFGVRVGQYMIGFGPTLWSRRIGETEYGFKALPLGGFISMAGMYPPAPEGEEPSKRRSRFFATMVQDARDANAETLIGGDDRAFYRLPVWKRIIIMLGGPAMNLVLAVVLFTIALSGIGIQQGTTTVVSVSECVIPASQQRQDCEPSDPVAPAKAAGMQPGDTMISIDGTPVSTFNEAAAIIQASPGKPLSMVIERDGAEQTVQFTPQPTDRAVTNAQGQPVTDTSGAPEYETIGFAGLSPQIAFEPQPIWTGVEATGQYIGQVATIMSQLPVRVYDVAVDTITGQPRDADSPMSVIGAGRMAGEIAAVNAPILERVQQIVLLLGGLNIALFAFNLIPLLPLDGGHVVVALWDGLKKLVARARGRIAKPVDATRLVPVTFVVVILLVGVGSVLFLADIFNPVKLL